MVDPNKPDASYDNYRQWIVAAEQKSQDDFDKTILSLAAGGLGVSMVFLKDIVGKNALVYPNVLLWSWACWAVSLLSILLSFFVSHLALRYIITKIDEGKLDIKNLGGKYTTFTKILNALGALSFVAGTVLMIVFAYNNFPTKGVSHDEASKTCNPPKTQGSPQALDGRLCCHAPTPTPTAKD